MTLLTVAVALTAFAAAPESGTATLPADREMTHADLVAAVDAAVNANAQYRGVSTSDLSAYAPYGLGALDGGLFYRGVRVRAFDDRAAGILALDTQGNVDVCAVRDENGALTGLRAATREEFDQNTMEEARIRAHWFGMEASAAENYIAPRGLTAGNGGAARGHRRLRTLRPVRRKRHGRLHGRDGTLLCGRGGGLRRAVQSQRRRGRLSAVRDENGALTGLRATGDGEYAAISSQQWYSEDEPADALVMQPMYTQEMKNNGLWIDDPDTAGGLNIAENGYADFGITTHQDLLLYDGEYVRYLEDEGANVHYENDGGTLDLYAVRDESGALTGCARRRRKNTTPIRSSTWPGKRTDGPAPTNAGPLRRHAQKTSPSTRMGDMLFTLPGCVRIPVPRRSAIPSIPSMSIKAYTPAMCPPRARHCAQARPSPNQARRKENTMSYIASQTRQAVHRLAQRYRRHERRRKEREEFQRLCAAHGIRPSWRDFLEAKTQTDCNAREYFLFRFYERPAALRETFMTTAQRDAFIAFIGDDSSCNASTPGNKILFNTLLNRTSAGSGSIPPPFRRKNLPLSSKGMAA